MFPSDAPQLQPLPQLHTQPLHIFIWWFWLFYSVLWFVCVSHRYIAICALCGVYVKNTCWVNKLILKYLKKKICEVWRERRDKQEEKGRPHLATPLCLPSVRLIIPSWVWNQVPIFSIKWNVQETKECFPFSGEGGLPWCFPLYKLMIVFKSQQVNSPGCRYFLIPGDGRKYQVLTSVCCPLLAKSWLCTSPLRMGTRLKLRIGDWLRSSYPLTWLWNHN